MERTLIAPGVHLSCDPAEKFNRCRISIHFAFPAQRATATAHALLPLVLERGYADCPDMTLLTKLRLPLAPNMLEGAGIESRERHEILRIQ